MLIGQLVGACPSRSEPTCRRPAHQTPAANIRSSQSSAPPPPLGAVTVNVAAADALLPPVGPVDRAFAAIVFV